DHPASLKDFATAEPMPPVAPTTHAALLIRPPWSVHSELFSDHLRSRVLHRQEAEDGATSKRRSALITDAGIGGRCRITAAIKSRDGVTADMLHRTIGVRKNTRAADAADFEPHA